MVFRIYVEKKTGLDNEARALHSDICGLLSINSVSKVRLLNRYDVENIENELFEYTVGTVFSEPQLDDVTYELEYNEGDTVFAVEYLPGQFDQRADSAAQCVQLISQKERPLVKTARVYILEGDPTAEELETIKKYVINPVESREATLDTFETLKAEYDIPESVRTLDGFTALDDDGLSAFVKENGLAMDLDDIKFCQKYFIDEQRDPTNDALWQSTC